MTEMKSGSGGKSYRLTQIEGKITWRIEELWDGGVTRGPFGTRDSAINAEERFARENGFIDELVLQEVSGQQGIPDGAFEKITDGRWRCVKSCGVDIENETIEFLAGMEFSSGTRYLGIDVPEWLEKNYPSGQPV